MDLQLYLDNKVYPILDLLLSEVGVGNFSKDSFLLIAKNLCDLESCSLESMKSISSVMGDDALTYFKERLNNL